MLRATVAVTAGIAITFFGTLTAGAVPVQAVTGSSPAKPSFDWRMPDRLTFAQSGLLNELTSDEINPKSWRVELTAADCPPPFSPGGPPIATPEHEWTAPANVVVHPGAPGGCRATAVFPALGVYAVTLRERSGGDWSPPATKLVVVRDFLVVSIGDSIAAGEGDPDRFYGDPRGLLWEDPRCHRSQWSGPAQAALALEQASPHTSVTFVNEACSGAGIVDGILGDYCGIDPNQPGGCQAQVAHVEEVLCPSAYRQGDKVECPDGYPRPVDALIVSAGANDVGFGDIAHRCAQDIPLRDPFHPVGWDHCEHDAAFVDSVNSALDDLPRRYALFAASLKRLGSPPVFITEYPDPTHDENGGYSDFPTLLAGLTSDEARWAYESVVLQLNVAVERAALTHGWHFISDIAEDFYMHGVSARDQNKRWINTIEDARAKQGPHCVPLCGPGDGVLHPNLKGYGAIRARILAQLTRWLSVGPVWQIEHGDKSLGFSDPARGLWFIGKRRCVQSACRTLVAVHVHDRNGLVPQSGNLTIDGRRACTAIRVGRHCRFQRRGLTSGIFHLVFHSDGAHTIKGVFSNGLARASRLNTTILTDFHDPSVTTSIRGTPDTGGSYKPGALVQLKLDDGAHGSGFGPGPAAVDDNGKPVQSFDAAIPQSKDGAEQETQEVCISDTGTHAVAVTVSDEAGRLTRRNLTVEVKGSDAEQNAGRRLCAEQLAAHTPPDCAALEAAVADAQAEIDELEEQLQGADPDAKAMLERRLTDARARLAAAQRRAALAGC